jgi:RNA polymerase sigma-B factor
MAGYQGYSDAKVSGMLVEYQRTDEPRLRDEIVEQMRPLVLSVARKFAGREPLEDLESEGFLGLIRAVDRFSPERGARFSTFAMHLIAGQIRHYLRDRGHLIRQPAWLQELNTRVQRTTAELEQRLQRIPTVAEIARATNVTEEGIEELLAARQAARVMRLEGPADGDDDDYLDVDPDKFRSKEYVTLQLPVEDRIVLEATLDKLKELERNVLYHFFYQDFTQSEIARKLGISCNYAGYVLRNGLKHMRERLPEERQADFHRLCREEGESVLDEITGLYTRDHFDNRLAEEISRSQRYRHPVSVCCLQLPMNCPDPVLLSAADTLRAKTRKADIVARTAPWEFGVILPNTGAGSIQVAMRLAEQLYPTVKGSIHAAAVTYPEGGRTAQQLFNAAREAAFVSGAPLNATPVLV